MHARGFEASVPFLFEFIAATIIVPIVPVAVVIPLLEFLVVPLVVAIVVVAAAGIAIDAVLPVAALVLVGSEALDKRSIAELQLTIGELGHLALDSVVMDGLLMPVVIGQLHIIGDSVGEPVALVGVLLCQGLVDDDLEVLAKVGEPRIAFRIFQGFWPCPKGLPGRDGIRRSDIQLEVGDQEKMIPQFMT